MGNKTPSKKTISFVTSHRMSLYRRVKHLDNAKSIYRDTTPYVPTHDTRKNVNQDVNGMIIMGPRRIQYT